MIVWGQDAAVARYVLSKVRDLPGESLQPAFIGALIARNGQPVGGVLYTTFSPTNLYLHCAIEGPVTRGDIAEVLGFAFNSFGVLRVTACIAKANKKSRAFVRRLGFRQEGVHPCALPNGRTLVTTGLLRDHCKWLDHPRADAWRAHFDQVKGAA